MDIKTRILDEIQAHGPMPFERFMAVALYDPEGFFGGNRLRSQKAGDFLTSPEVSPLFGEMLAEYVRREHERIGDPFQLVEVGAGSGSLIRSLLAAYAVEARAVEASPAARNMLAGLVPTSGSLPDSIRGVVLANELLDNLPMGMAQRVGDVWRERWVAHEDGDLVFVDADPRPEVVDWLEAYAGPVEEGGWVEVQIEARRWLEDLLGRIVGGSVLLIDYGDTAENLASRRRDGTLRTYRSHHLGPHPLEEPGETDITADVNFSALLDLGIPTTLERQDDFLSRLGLRDRLSEVRDEELQAARSSEESERLRLRALRVEAETLLHPRGLGDFRVLRLEVPEAVATK